MKKKQFIGLLTIVTTLLLSSCATTTIGSTRTVKTSKVVNLTLRAPIVAELDVQATKVTGQAMNHSSINIETLKALALKTTIGEAKCDVLVEPVYEFFYSGGLITNVTVTGYPATYKTFRHIEKEDSFWLNKMF